MRAVGGPMLVASLLLLLLFILGNVLLRWMALPDGHEAFGVDSTLSLDRMTCADLLASKHNLVPNLSKEATNVVGDLVRGFKMDTANGGSALTPTDADVCVMRRPVMDVTYNRDRCSFGVFTLDVADGKAVHPEGCIFDPDAVDFDAQLRAAFAAKNAGNVKRAQDLQDTNHALAESLETASRKVLGLTQDIATLSAGLARPMAAAHRDADFKTSVVRHARIDASAGLGSTKTVLQKAFTVDGASEYFTMAFKYCSASTNDPYELWTRAADINVSELDGSDATSFLSDTTTQYRNDALLRSMFGQRHGRASGRVIIEVYQNNDDTILSTIVFDTTGGDDLVSWFAQRNLHSSSITALNGQSSSFNVFSLEGEFGRRFFISVSYRGCDLDHGAFAIPTRTDVCWWDAAYRYAIVSAKDDFIGFGTGTTAVHPGRPYNDMMRNQVGNRMIVWVSATDGLQDLRRYSVPSSYPNAATSTASRAQTAANMALSIHLPSAPAIDLGAYGMGPWSSASRFVDPLARWLWNIPSAASDAPTGVDVTFQREIRNTSSVSTDVTLHIIVDNRATVSLNLAVIQAVSGGWWTPTYPRIGLVLEPGTNLLNIVAVNDGGPAGLLFSMVRDVDGSVVMRSDSGTAFY